MTTYLGKQTPLNDVWKLNKFNFSLELEGIHFACEAQPSETWSSKYNATAGTNDSVSGFGGVQMKAIISTIWAKMWSL